MAKKLYGSTKGKRRYRCDDCGECTFRMPYEFTRAAKPHCNRCGCTRLIISDAGHDDEVERATRVVENPPPSTVVEQRPRRFVMNGPRPNKE